MNGRIFSLIILAFFTLSACTSMSFTGMYRLSQLSPLTVAPDQIKVAIKANENINIRTGDVNLKLGYWADDKSLNIDEEFLVEVIQNTSISANLFDDKEADENITILQLSTADTSRFKEVQSLVSAYKEKDGQGKGMFSFGINNFCLKRDIPTNKLEIDMKIQTSEEDGFFSFLSDFNLADIAKDNKQTNVDLYCPA